MYYVYDNKACNCYEYSFSCLDGKFSWGSYTECPKVA